MTALWPRDASEQTAAAGWAVVPPQPYASTSLDAEPPGLTYRVIVAPRTA